MAETTPAASIASACGLRVRNGGRGTAGLRGADQREHDQRSETREPETSEPSMHGGAKEKPRSL
jgi:hypothetical protein